MSDDPTNERELDEFLEIRKPGAHLEEGVVADDFVLMLGVDLANYPKFPRVDDTVTYPKAALDIRQQLDVDSGAELPDYSGPYRADLRFTDFSKEALAAQAPAVERGVPAALRRRLGRGGGPAVRPRDDGRDRVGGVERSDRARARAHEGRVPARRHRPTTIRTSRFAEADRATTRVVYTGLFTPRPDAVDLTKEQLVTWFLGSHEYLLQCIEAWATQIVVRYSLDEMFDIQWTLWGDTVLPGAKKLKAEYLGITGNTVADWMKDLQMDATALPGKAFDLSFEMPEPDVGIMTFNRCVAVDQWEGDGTAGHPREELPLDLSEVDDRDDQDVQPEHEGRHPRHPAARGSRRRVLQVALQHARRGRPRVRAGRAQPPPAVALRPASRGARAIPVR